MAAGDGATAGAETVTAILTDMDMVTVTDAAITATATTAIGEITGTAIATDTMITTITTVTMRAILIMARTEIPPLRATEAAVTVHLIHLGAKNMKT